MTRIKKKYISLAKSNLIVIDQVVVSLFRFLLTIIIAKSLGVNQYGTYVIMWSYILFLGSLQIPFIINPLMTLGAKALNNKNSNFFSFYFYLQIWFSVFSFVLLSIIFLISFFFFESFDFKTYIGLVLCGVSYNLYEFYRRYFFTIAKEIKVLWADTSIYLVLLGFISVLIFKDIFTLQNFFFVSFLIYFSATITLHLHVKFHKVKTIFLQIHLKKNISYSTPMVKQSIMQFLSGHIFIYVAYLILGDYSAGVIGILRNLFAPLIVGLMAIDNLMPRRGMYFYEKEPKALIKYINSNIQNWGGLFLLFITTLMIFGKTVIEIIYGHDYIKYSIFMGWFAVSHIAMLLNRILSIYCRTICEMSVFSKQGIISFVFTLIASYPLIKLFGLNGAFMVMLVQQILMLIIIVKDSKYYEFSRK
jgi:O-antigen/teichoic acid export membrane protein